MPAEQSIADSFHVSPRFKHLLEAAATRERRSQTNMLATLLLDFREQQGIKASRHQGIKASRKIAELLTAHHVTMLQVEQMLFSEWTFD